YPLHSCLHSTACEHVLYIDIIVGGLAVVLHLVVDVSLHLRAGADYADHAGLRNVQAHLGGGGVHGFPGADADALAGGGEFNVVLVGDRYLRRLGGFRVQFDDLAADVRRRRTAGLLVVAAQVVAVALQQVQ
ncbi:hypothetical protein, partial [Pseudomonas aeruginosa]|uniref:hypothetical protein n=1 Tax=Pseudomonas aeruginosa TaxID=287 RepID=UPI004045E7FC